MNEESMMNPAWRVTVLCSIMSFTKLFSIISSHKIKNTNYKKQTITNQTNKQIINMVNSQQLQKETATFLNKEVLAIGVFDVSLNAGKRNVAPAAAGLAAGLITKQIQKKIIKNKNSDGENDDKQYTMGNRMITGAVGLATGAGTQQLMKHHDAKKNGLTPIMIVAVTKNKIYLLDWKGNHNKGTGPTEILAEFNRSEAKIKNHTRALVHHTIEIKEDGNSCKIECNLGATHSNKQMNREVIDLLKQN
jgi:hypothetical protein